MCSLRLIPKQNHRILESYQDFILSRQATLLSPKTIEFYERTVGELVSYLSDRGIDEPEGITSALVRGYFSSVAERGVASATVHAHARGMRTQGPRKENPRPLRGGGISTQACVVLF